jgi:pilus assembly protein Flp/PilA
MKRIFNNLIADEKGVTAIEYGLIAALVAVVIIGAVEAVGTSLQSTFSTVSTELSTANGG